MSGLSQFLPNSPSISRRNFLGLTLTGAAGVFLYKYYNPAKAPSVAILGAGAAGLACALQLKRNQIPFTIFEGSSRIGGRVFTQNNWNKSNQFIEIGGELIDSGHHTTFSLIKDLTQEQNRPEVAKRAIALEHLELLRFADSENSKLQKTLFVDGKNIYSESQLIKGLQPVLQSIQDLNQKLWTDQDQGLYFNNKDRLPLALKYDHMSLQEYLNSFQGQTEDWVLKVLKAAYESEFGREADRQSALNLISLIDTNAADGFSIYGESDESLRLKNGNSSLIRAILNSLTNYGQLPLDSFLKMDHQLESINRNGSDFELGFSGRSPMTFTHVICCLPFQIVRELGGIESLGISSTKMQMIQHLGIGSNSKIMMDFDQKFWRASKKNANQGEHFFVDGSQVFWETSRMQKGEHGILTNFLAARDADQADQNRVQKSIRDLQSVYGNAIDHHHTGKSVLMDWQKNPWSKGSYGCLSPGQYSQFWGSGPQTENRGRLIFAGEHTSMVTSGFIDGAYESGIRAANQLVKVLS